ncbi:MAG: TRAP transporter small permease [Nitrospinota bacterium]|nr:TRAP transporter small permease [Nitrospinota bacterium]
MQIVKKFDAYLAKIETSLIILILSFMVLISFGQVILRNFFNQGILWADIFLRQMVLWVSFLGASLATRENRHIAIDFFPYFMSPSLKTVTAISVRLCVGAISFYLAWAAWKFVQFEKEGGATLFLDLPVWGFQIILPFSFTIIAVRFLLQVIQELNANFSSAYSDEGKNK